MSAADGIAAAAAAMPAAAVWLAPDDSIAADCKKAVGAARAAAGESGPLPPVTSLSRLTAAARAAPRLSFAAAARAGMALGAAAEDGGESALKWRLCELLREHESLSAAARLRLAGKLSRLFDELDLRLRPGESADPFAPLLAGGGAPSHEATLAATAWERLGGEAARRNGGVWSRLLESARGERIAALTDEETPPAEADFYRQAGAAVFSAPAAAAGEAALGEFLRGDGGGGDDCCDHLRDCWEGGGASLTETARLALAATRRFLADGAPGGVGVAVYDRQLARRFRAVAEADGLLMEDRLGWRAETLSAGAALRTFADAALGEFSAAAPAMILSPPFFAGDAAAAERALRRWRRRLARGEGGTSAREWREGETANFAAGLAAAARRAPRRTATAAAWTDWLAVESAPMLLAWRDDAVFAALLARLRRRGGEAMLRGGEEFRLWLEDELANSQCADADMESPVALVSPASRRRFGAIVLLGYADDGGATGDDGWLGVGEREKLGLPTAAARADRRLRRFCRLMARHERVAVIWRRADDSGEETPAHPFWALLARRLRGRGRLRTLAGEDAAAVGLRSAAAAAAGGAEPGGGGADLGEARWRRWPAALSVTAADRLMRCPYLFHARDLLGLSDDDDDDDDDALSPRLRGALLHRSLAAFSAAARGAESEEALAAHWREAVLGEAAAMSHPSAALAAAHWLVCGSALTSWEWSRRLDGWRTTATEESVSAEWRGVKIIGRIDRADSHAEWGEVVIDYKSGVLPGGKSLAAGEAPQAPLYAWLRGRGGSAALCKPFEKRGAAMAMRMAESTAPPARVAARLRGVLRAIADGRAMPRNGAAAVCRGCAAGGVGRCGEFGG